MDAQDWLARNEGLLESPWERLFVEAVLARVPGLDFANVTAQRPFRDFEGKQRRSDFAIEQGQDIRIVIEVKGLMATPDTMRDFVADSKKAITLQSEGWQALDFANSVFGKTDGDGPPKPRQQGAEACAKLIGLEIERQKKSSAAIRESASLRERTRLLEQCLDDAQRAKDDARGRLQRAEQQAESVRDELNRVRHENNPERERVLREQLEEAKAQLSERDLELKARSAELEQVMAQAAEYPAASLTRTQWGVYERLRDEMAQAMEALRAEVVRGEQQQPADRETRIEWAAERSPSRWKWLTGGALGGLVVVGLAAGAGWLTLGKCGDDPPPPPPSSPAATASPRAATCETTTDWAFMTNCAGKQVTAKGPIAGASYQASVNGKPTFLNMGNDFPEKRRLEVVIWGNCRSKFPFPPETAYRGKVVYVTGTVNVREGVPQIEVCSSNQITVEP